jgi:hypothetical protein
MPVETRKPTDPNAAKASVLVSTFMGLTGLKHNPVAVKLLEGPLEVATSMALKAIDDLKKVGSPPEQKASDEPRWPQCVCRRCREEEVERNPLPPGRSSLFDTRIAVMILCYTCGNKRCPHANDHRNACTHSNEPGQKGSAYE